MKKIILFLFVSSTSKVVTTATFVQVTINLNNQHQVIDGFGASSAWCGSIRDNVMNSLYGDLGYSILRVRIEEGIGDRG